MKIIINEEEFYILLTLSTSTIKEFQMFDLYIFYLVN